MKHLDQARKYATHAYEHLFVLSQMADAYRTMGNTAEEERLRLEIIRTDSGNAYAFEAYGHFLNRQKRLDEAIEAFRSAVEIKPYPNVKMLLRRTMRKRDSILKSRI
ncbi:MAG TPA: hypothetical protein VK465_03215 [Fibrobacteria bacterium]|nr:hypothetical protein [Fibrobacteria bacterium]